MRPPFQEGTTVLINHIDWDFELSIIKYSAVNNSCMPFHLPVLLDMDQCHGTMQQAGLGWFAPVCSSWVWINRCPVSIDHATQMYLLVTCHFMIVHLLLFDLGRFNDGSFQPLNNDILRSTSGRSAQNPLGLKNNLLVQSAILDSTFSVASS